MWLQSVHRFTESVAFPKGHAEDDRERLARLLRYLMRSPVSFKRLKIRRADRESDHALEAQPGEGVRKRSATSPYHAVDFLAALARHVPRARQQTVTYAGHYANATGNLSPKTDQPEEEQEVPVQTGGRRYVPWNLLVLRCWAVDPELCPRCGERMEREKPVYKQPALSQLLKSLRVGKYPQRPPPAPPPQTQAVSNHDSEYSNAQQFGDNVVQLFPDDNFNQVPPGW